MGITICNPYGPEDLNWFKGNLHTHTTQSDGPHSPQDTIDAYAARGYDFLLLSDHDHCTDTTRLDHHGMALIPGNEVSASGPHILHINAHELVAPDPNRQNVIDAINAGHGFAVVCHPNYWHKTNDHCPHEELEAWQGYAGIEIFNGVITWLPGSAHATDRWDKLLSKGRRIWGFANDDCHAPDDLAMGWNVVQAHRAEVGEIVSALREGRFYASSGVVIERISVRGRTIHIETANAQRIVVYSDYAFRETYVDGPTITYTVPEGFKKHYVRFECWGAGQTHAWTQPFFLERT